MKLPKSPARVLVWDLPARVCHWGFALSISMSLIIAFRYNPESEIFKYHMPLGLIGAWFLAIRIVLGFCGGVQSRWRSFFHPPLRTLRYFADVVRWRDGTHQGLNPGTSLFAPAAYLALVALIVTGFQYDWVETWHGRLAWGMIGLIAVHLLGLTLHALRHRALTPLAMIHGRGEGLEDGATGRHRLAGIILLLFSGLVVWGVFARFNPETSTLLIPCYGPFYFPLTQRG